MEDDERPRSRSVLVGARLDFRRVQHQCIGLEAGQLVRVRLDEHRLGEECVVGVRGDDPNADPVRGIGSGVGVRDVDRLLLLEVGDHLLAEPFERLLVDRLIHGAPPDPVYGLGLLDDELVLRRAAREQLLYGAGLRVGEAVGLERGGVDLENRLVRCVGKGDKERIVPIGGHAVAALRRYLAHGRPHLDRRHRPQSS